MKGAPIGDREAFWKWQSAASAFEQVQQVCDFLSRDDVNDSHPLFYPLVTALCALYGRPFKQREPMRLSADLVPAEFQDLHLFMIRMRDQMFAHLDTEGVRTVEGMSLNKVIVSVQGTTSRRGFVFLFPLEMSLDRISRLAARLEKKTLYHANKIWTRHMRREPLGPGEYEVNLSHDDDEFLVPLRL